MVAKTFGNWAQKQKRSWFKPHCGQSMESVWVVEGDGRTHSEHYQGTLGQGSKSTIAHVGVDLPSPLVYPPCDLKRDKAVNKTRPLSLPILQPASAQQLDLFTLPAVMGLTSC